MTLSLMKKLLDVILVANRDETKYKLYLTSEKNVPQRNIVGEFVHEEDSNFRFYIIVDDKEVEQARQRELCIAMRLDESGAIYCAFLTHDLLSKLQRDKFRVSALWHELGHAHNGDFDDDLPKDIGQSRKQSILAGMVMDQELLADEFACRRFGRLNLIRTLELMVQEREQLGDKAAGLAIQEMRWRIAHQRKLAGRVANAGQERRHIRRNS